MKLTKKLLPLVLAILLCCAILTACGGKTKNNSTAITGSLSVLQGKELIKGAEYHYTLAEGCCETVNLMFLVTDEYDPNIGPDGIYMLDMDTGAVYDHTFLNWDIMIKGDGWNMDTRETALMVFFNSYDCNKDGTSLWSEEDTFIHYSESELKELSAQLSGGKFSAAADAQISDVPTADQSDISVDELTEHTMDPEFVYEQTKILNTQLKSVAQYQYKLEEGCCEQLNLLFVESTEMDNIDYPTFAAPGIYMMDMDTGIWYDGTCMDNDQMVIGNRWNFETKETTLMCFFTFYESHENNGQLWSGSETLVFMEQADIDSINQKLLIDELTRVVSVYPYAGIDEEPRQLSDVEIEALLQRPAGYVKSMISTVPDAIAYLDLRFPELHMGMNYNNGDEINKRWLRSAVEILSDSMAPAARSCVANCITYLLSDNYDIQSLIAFWPDPDTVNDDGPEKAINAIKTTNGYLFFDAALRMRGDAISRKGVLLPEMQCGSIAEYIENIRQNPALADVVKYIFKNTNGSRMDFIRSFAGGYTIETNSPGIELVYYSIPAKEPGMDIKPENIGSYKISKLLGGVTLTADEARALVDAEPEVVQEKVKTAADVLMYMLAARIGDSHGCKCTPVDGHTWHWNMSAKEVMYNKLGNCGSCANLANYLLDGDYEEVGYMDQAYYPGNGGSHVYTYILHEGKYYILDYSWYIFSNYEITQDFGIPVLNALEEWPEMIQWIYGPVCLVMTYDTPGMQYPVIFGEEYQTEFGGVYYVLPEDVEYTILYEAPDGYQYYHIPFDTGAYDWNVFWKE